MAWLDDLLREDPPPVGDLHAGRFEGIYGGLYDRVIQTDAIRRFAGVAYGDARPVADLDGFVARVVAGTAPAGSAPPVLLDVPTGGRTLLPRLERAGYDGRVIATDLGGAMLARAERVAARLALDVAFLRADAQDLQLADGTVDAAVSLNGLHCIPDPRAFVHELARVVRPGGRLFLVTLVRGGAVRADAAIAVGRLAGILPGPPPTREELLRDLDDAGFGAVEPLGGAGLTGLAAERV